MTYDYDLCIVVLFLFGLFFLTMYPSNMHGYLSKSTCCVLYWVMPSPEMLPATLGQELLNALTVCHLPHT
jgi:hypothetical protein